MVVLLILLMDYVLNGMGYTMKWMGTIWASRFIGTGNFKWNGLTILWNWIRTTCLDVVIGISNARRMTLQQLECKVRWYINSYEMYIEMLPYV